MGEFAKLNGITLDAKPEVKAAPDVKKTEIKKTPGVKKADGGGKKMPGNNNPWAGELASRNKKKNSVGRQTSQQGKSPDCASPPVQPVEEGKKEVFTSERTP